MTETQVVEQLKALETRVAALEARLGLDELRLRQKFDGLVQQWHEDTLPLSDVSKKVVHPAYQEIIGMGEPAIPLILHEMERRPGHWFWALRAITGESPVPPEDAGNVPKMTQAWLAWGRERGYIR
jgi:hypothetical protein